MIATASKANETDTNRDDHYCDIAVYVSRDIGTSFPVTLAPSLAFKLLSGTQSFLHATKSSPLAPVWVITESKLPSESKMTRSGPGEPPV
jgi:hypothetical protein